MKHLLLSLSFLFITIFSFGQCDPIYDFGEEVWGIAPDTVENLADGMINSFYTQQIDVLVPENGDPFDAPFEIQVDSASIVNIIGLPDGLSIECNSPLPTPCTYLGGEQGCGIISGIPTEAGVFELTVAVMVYSELINLPIFIENYEITISDPLSDGVENVNETEIILFPNPAQNSVEINFDYHQSEPVSIKVYDIVGKEALSLTANIQPGNNSFNLPIEELREGTYIVRLEGMNISTTKRLVVSK